MNGALLSGRVRQQGRQQLQRGLDLQKSCALEAASLGAKAMPITNSHIITKISNIRCGHTSPKASEPHAPNHQGPGFCNTSIPPSVGPGSSPALKIERLFVPSTQHHPSDSRPANTIEQAAPSSAQSIQLPSICLHPSLPPPA